MCVDVWTTDEVVFRAALAIFKQAVWTYHSTCIAVEHPQGWEPNSAFQLDPPSPTQLEGHKRNGKAGAERPCECVH